jgi:hypothetical protein
MADNGTGQVSGKNSATATSFGGTLTTEIEAVRCKACNTDTVRSRRKEEAFVFAKEDHAEPAARRSKAAPSKTAGKGGERPAPPPSEPAKLQELAGRVPLNSRIRPKFATALKRASLERELAGEEPHTIQDIVEQGLEPWLKEHGYLKD